MEGNPECEEDIETEEDSDDFPNVPYEPLGRIPALNPDVDIPDVYGPSSRYDDNRNQERNRQREELRKLRQMEILDSIVDKPTKCVYGPKP